MPGTNFASSFSADIENYIADKVLPLARRQLCAYRFGVNTRGSRAALVANDNLDSTTINRTSALMVNLGAPRFLGDEQTDTDKDVDQGGGRASENPRMMPHYAAIIHPFVVADFSNASDVKTAWQYSDLNRLYNFEAGEWRGIRFCQSNMVPTWTGVAAIIPTAATTGALATGTYYFVVTASDTQNQYESRIYQVSTGIAVTGPTGSVTVVLPSLPGFTFSVYIGTTTSPANLGLCALGPTYGPLSGQATQLAGGQTVTITGTGVAQVPPAAPATGITVYPTYVFGRGAYGQVKLDNAKFALLKDPDKSDPMNQIRVLSWKLMYSTILLNILFACRIESTSSISGAFG
jgi:hypothetical protein